jgi:hypothetical protein
MKFLDTLPLLLSMTTPSVHAESALTIYNQDFAVARETLPLNLKAGVNEVRYADMVSRLEPDSVILRDPAGKAGFQILEQGYRNDPVSQELLLSLFEGKTIDFFVKEPNKPDAIVPGKIIRSGFKTKSQPVVEVDGKLRFILPGQPMFPSLGDDTVLNPTLTWKIEAPREAKFDAELGYVTAGFSWEADYNLIAPETGNQADLIGWVTLRNDSGKTFRDARIKLMAGDVNKIQPPAPRMARMAMKAEMAYDMAPPVSEKAFDEFHLYSLAHPTTLRDRESKQVEFVRAVGVRMDRVYVYDGARLDGWRDGMAYGENPDYGAESNKKVAVHREFKNTTDNHLGIPLPKGRVRFYTQDGADQSLQFVGENTLDHTPKDETIRLYTGDSFDLVGERKRLDFQVDTANRRARESYEIKLRNHKKEGVEIRVIEHLFRWLTWSIEEKSQPYDKRDAQTIQFTVALKPDEEKTVTYTVKYTW